MKSSPWLLVLALLAWAVPGCTENAPEQHYQLRTDMYRQPSFRHNRDPRPAADRTVQTAGFEPGLKDSALAARLTNPFSFSRTTQDTARVLFETYCQPCHGIAAKGDGPVAPKFQQPPDLTTQKYIKAPDGYLYSVVRNGIRIMPPYDENTSARERWMIVAYLRSLQRQ